MLASSVPNHHADHHGFRGLSGLVAALSFTVGRGPVARLAADLTGVGPDDRVVDIGCGPGTAVREARRRGATATGVDPATVMVRVGRLLSPSSITWEVGSAEALPVADGAATVVWSLATVHHWRDVASGLAEVRRVLEPGGRFLVTERCTRAGARGHASHGWTDQQAEAFAVACATAGLTDVHVETHRPGGTAVLAVTASG